MINQRYIFPQTDAKGHKPRRIMLGPDNVVLVQRSTCSIDSHAGHLGVTLCDMPENFAIGDIRSGVLIADLHPDDLIASVGLRKGDVIEEVNGITMRSHREALSALSHEGSHTVGYVARAEVAAALLAKRERHSVRAQPARLLYPATGMRAVQRTLMGSWSLLVLWSFELANYVDHFVLRPVPLAAPVQLLGYVLLGLQVASIYHCQTCHPGQVGENWVDRAAQGQAAATVCHRSARLLPPRAMWCSRHGDVVPGLDHWCRWINTAVGLCNRRFFLQFLLYSWALTVYSGSLFVYECVHHMEYVHVDVFSSTWRLGLTRWLIGLNACVFVLLSIFLHIHATHAARNVMTFGGKQRDFRYDVGLLPNLEQIFGRRRLYWLLPGNGDGPGTDGLWYPERDAPARQRDRKQR